MDEEKLADAYNRALALEKSGDFDAAAQAYEDVLEIDPDDHGGVGIRMASMGKAPSPARASQAYVSTLFDQHAEVFDKVLVDDLGYDVPKMSANLIKKHKITQLETMLDLGCGTGLMGLALANITDDPMTMTGLDLSENMVEIAYDREIYETLYVADVQDYLDDNDDGPWSLICAGDVLPYLGDIEQLIRGMANNVTPDGYILFSTETLEPDKFKSGGYIVGSYQRFAHDLNYIKKTLLQNNFNTIEIENIIVRHEQGLPIFGHLVLAQSQT